MSAPYGYATNPRIRNKVRRHWNPESGVRVNLGCGFDYREGWTNVDKFAPRADVRADLFEFPWPLPKDKADFVLADQIIEHIPPILKGPKGTNDGLLLFLRELHRILKPGGRAYLGTPHFGDPLNAITNVTHYRFFNENSLDFLDPTLTDERNTVSEQVGVRFKVLAKIVAKRVRFFGLDSQYHVQKYLLVGLNVGRPYGLIFILEKLA